MTGEQDSQPASDFPTAIGKPATNALAAAGYYQLAQLATVSAKEVGRIHGVGPKAIGILRANLEAQGLTFVDD